MTKTLIKGDCIVVCFRNRLYPAIFKEFGPKGNPRFYYLFRFLDIVRCQTGNPDKIFYYVDFINRIDNSIAKISPYDLSDENYNNYLEIKKLLKL